MTKSRIARRIYEETPKETKDMVRLYGKYMVEREKKSLNQSYSCFTEEMYLGKNIPSSSGGGFWETVNDSRISLNEVNVIGNNRITESEEYLGLRNEISSNREASHLLIFQSSINPKK